MRLYQRNEYFTHPLQNPTLLAIRKIKAMNYHRVRYSVCQSHVRQGKRASASFSCHGAAITLAL
jgi:hypothetical protein